MRTHGTPRCRREWRLRSDSSSSDTWIHSRTKHGIYMGMFEEGLMNLILVSNQAKKNSLTETALALWEENGKRNQVFTLNSRLNLKLSCFLSFKMIYGITFANFIYQVYKKYTYVYTGNDSDDHTQHMHGGMWMDIMSTRRLAAVSDLSDLYPWARMLSPLNPYFFM